MQLSRISIPVALLISVFSSTWIAQAEPNAKIVVENGQKIAFLGDSITAAGRGPMGYCQLVLLAMKDQGIETTGVFAGIGGHKSDQMLARLEKDVLKHKPDWMTLSCGVNDVWHGARGVALEPYKKNITAIVDQAQAAGVKVVLLTSTMIKEDQSTDLNQKLVPYNEFICALAKEKNCLLADLNADMQNALTAFPADAPKGKQLTSDGVHMNAYGNMMMARGVAKAMGLSDAQLDASEVKWRTRPNAVEIRIPSVKVSLKEMEQLNAKADKAGKRIQDILAESVRKDVDGLLK
jgi:lysophospholipase L1-like esterase